MEHPRPEREMADFYGSCDMFVFSSRGEGFGLPALEAMAVRLPGHHHGLWRGAPVRDGRRNCVMVPPANAPALAEAIQSLVSDPDRRARLRAAASRPPPSTARTPSNGSAATSRPSPDVHDERQTCPVILR